MLDWEAVRNMHIVGIGGAGMSAIARILKARGIHVTGSDQRESPTVQALRAEGIPVTIGPAPDLASAADALLASSAVPESDAELQAARAQGRPVLRRPDILPWLTAGYHVIAVAGAHGKTTVTSMLTFVFTQMNLDPSFIIGGISANLGTNGHLGQGKHFIIEADEYMSTFLCLSPNIAVVTNVEYDHPDCFPSLRHLRFAFGEFVERIQPGGLLVACSDDPIAHALAASYHANGGHLTLYGREEGPGVTWRALNIRPNEIGGVDFEVQYQGQALWPMRLSVPGAHNALNALAVLAVADAVGLAWNVAAMHLRHYQGTERRFQLLGEAAGVTVIDDYAHHPTQIRYVLEAARQRYLGQRILAVWQPHTFSRIKALWDGYLTAFDNADAVYILPIYAAREVDDGSVSHTDLAGALKHPQAEACASLAQAAQRLQEIVRPGDVVVLMGAGNEYLVGQALLHALTGGAA